MIVCKASDKILIGFDNEIIVLKNTKNYPIDNNYYLEYEMNIQNMKLSYHEKLLAVALGPCSD